MPFPLISNPFINMQTPELIQRLLVLRPQIQQTPAQSLQAPQATPAPQNAQAPQISQAPQVQQPILGAQVNHHMTTDADIRNMRSGRLSPAMDAQISQERIARIRRQREADTVQLGRDRGPTQ